PSVQVTPNNPNGQLKPAGDHLVALKNAWDSGAGAWTVQGLRFDFANEWRGVQLITTSYTTNSSKQQDPIQAWQPPNAQYLCSYAEMWVAVKYQWRLNLDNAPYPGAGPGHGLTEYQYLEQILSSNDPNC